jgi:hypothetical protein
MVSAAATPIAPMTGRRTRPVTCLDLAGAAMVLTVLKFLMMFCSPFPQSGTGRW